LPHAKRASKHAAGEKGGRQVDEGRAEGGGRRRGGRNGGFAAGLSRDPDAGINVSWPSPEAILSELTTRLVPRSTGERVFRPQLSTLRCPKPSPPFKSGHGSPLLGLLK
jgi:hypothetical protein